MFPGSLAYIIYIYFESKHTLFIVGDTLNVNDFLSPVASSSGYDPFVLSMVWCRSIHKIQKGQMIVLLGPGELFSIFIFEAYCLLEYIITKKIY